MTFRKPVILALSLLLLGCATIPVNYDYDRQANWSSYKTYDWYAASARAKGKAAGVVNPIMDSRVRHAVEQELATRGYKLEKTGEPDFLVTYYPVYQDHTVVTQSGMYGGWGYRRPFGYGVAVPFTDVYQYRDGAIVLEIVDHKTNQMVWQAIGQGALTGIVDPRDADEQVAGAVKQILARFPPPVTTK